MFQAKLLTVLNSNISKPMNKQLAIFPQDIVTEIDKRLQIINKALSDYAKLHGIPNSEMKRKTEMIEPTDRKSFYYGSEMIVSVQNGFEFNGVSFLINYELHESLK